jgi:hypothetical protein
LTSTESYRVALRDLPAADWEPYLLAHSNLPGPRGNLELAAAAADLGTEAQFRRWSSLGPDVAPENTPACFLAFCGVVGLGAVMARRGGFPAIDAPIAVNKEPAGDGRPDIAQENPPLQVLHALASDPRWRIREGVAMALQRWGDADMAGLLAEMVDWSAGNPLEQRAAAAALCEPRLLRRPEHAAAVLKILDGITARLARPLGFSETLRVSDARVSDARKTLRQGLGYCWSVAVAALPEAGKPLMEKWLVDPDPDVRWIMRENLKKNRLVRIDAAWGAQWRALDSAA